MVKNIIGQKATIIKEIGQKLEISNAFLVLNFLSRNSLMLILDYRIVFGGLIRG